jgi:hypothetical protein
MNPASMQNMNMMAQQQQQQQQNNSGANMLQQLAAHYRGQQSQLTNPQFPQGWWQTVQPVERAGMAQQLCNVLQLLNDGNQVEAVGHAIKTETQLFKQSQSKEQYNTAIRMQLHRITQLRQQRLQGMQNNLNNNGMNPGQMAMMGQGARPNPQQQFPQGFPNAQLQRPMQLSTTPMSQNPSSMGVNAANAGNFPQGQNPSQPNMQPPPSQTSQHGPQFDAATISTVGKRLMDNARDEIRAKFQLEADSWPQETRAALHAKGIDPLFFRFRQQAELLLRTNKINANTLQLGQAAKQNGPVQHGQQNQQMNPNQRQPNQDFDFNAITNQQIEALRVQDQGQTVVPATTPILLKWLASPDNPGNLARCRTRQWRANKLGLLLSTCSVSRCTPKAKLAHSSNNNSNSSSSSSNNNSSNSNSSKHRLWPKPHKGT